MNVFQDSRFVTKNTNLASCIGALKIPLKNVTLESGEVRPDYIRRIEDAETGAVTIYWCFEDEGRNYVAREVEGHWAHRERFESENYGHPLIPMRLALEKLEWVTKVWHRNIIPQVREGLIGTVTKDTNLAACLIACGFELIAFDEKKREFGFGSVPAEILVAYDNYRNTNHPIGTMRLALEVRKLLINELKRPDIVTQVHYKNGDPMNGGKECLIFKDRCDEEQLSALLEKLYE